MTRDFNAAWRKILILEVAVWVAGLVYFVIYLFHAETMTGEPAADDPIAWSMFLAALVAVPVARSVQSRFLRRLNATVSDGLILSDQDDPATIGTAFARLASRSFAILVVVLLVLVVGGIAIETRSNPLGKPHLIAGASLAAVLIATRFAHGVAASLVLRQFKGPETVFVLNPDAQDKAAGFGILGYAYYNQALLVLIPFLFLAFWLVAVEFAINAGPALKPDGSFSPVAFGNYIVCAGSTAPTDQSQCPQSEWVFLWRDDYLVAMAINLVVFVLSAFLPMSFLARHMRKSRRLQVWPHVEELSAHVHDLRARYREDRDDPTAFAEMQARVAPLAAELTLWRACPVFPIPVATAAATLISNLSGILGLLGFAIG
ncbi:MAG: hypothetical protein AAGF88_07845 [Pseudomonadota bacterium]